MINKEYKDFINESEAFMAEYNKKFFDRNISYAEIRLIACKYLWDSYNKGYDDAIITLGELK